MGVPRPEPKSNNFSRSRLRPRVLFVVPGLWPSTGGYFAWGRRINFLVIYVLVGGRRINFLVKTEEKCRRREAKCSTPCGLPYIPAHLWASTLVIHGIPAHCWVSPFVFYGIPAHCGASTLVIYSIPAHCWASGLIVDGTPAHF